MFVGLVLAVLPQAVSLDGISIERARAMNGQLVTASFIVGKPSYTLKGFTVLGANDREEWAERGAVLKGNHLNIDMGERVKVIGILRVIDHPPSFVNRQLVPAWVEIRVQQ